MITFQDGARRFLPPAGAPLLVAAIACAALLAASSGAAAQEAAGPVRLTLPLLGVSGPGQPADGKTIILGGPSLKRAVVAVNVPLVRRVLLEPGDLLGASLRVTVVAGPSRDGTLELLRLLRPATDDAPVAGVDFDAEPLATAAVAPGGGAVELGGLAEALSNYLAGEWEDHGLLVRLAGGGGDAALRLAGPSADAGAKPQLAVSIRSHPKADLFVNDLRPRPGVYATVTDGHLHYDGQRLRLWGVVGYPNVERMRKMGFNAQRVWNPTSQTSNAAAGFYTEESARRGEPVGYAKGDGSKMDVWDRQFAELKNAGMFVMFASLVGTMPLEPLLADDSFIAGGDDWPAWKAAVTTSKARLDPIALVDERLLAMRKRHARNLLTHVNQHTGKAYGQDEAIVVYEISNERGFAKSLLEGSFEAWPPHFREKLQRRWNDFLRDRHGDDAALAAAWGTVGDGESLADGTVELGPIFKARNEHPEPRAADFVRFVVELVDDFNQDFRDYCRSLAPEGVGVNVAPFSFDTQYRPSTAWSYNQSRGDVNSIGMYFWNLDSTLDEPPSAYVLDANTVEGMPTILYETNAGRPSPYRSEYPLKLAAMAGWQDWDGVFWHYWHAGPGDVHEGYLAAALPHQSAEHFWQAVHHEVDPVMGSSMAIAGRMFLGGRVAAAPNPTVFTVGGGALFGFGHHNGVGQAQQTFATGSRTRFDPAGDGGVTVDGAAPPAPRRLTDAVAAGDQILWDWPNGRLVIDAPTAKAYVGRVDGAYRFKDGIVLGGVGTPSVAFAMVSADGRPLAGPDASGRIHVTAVRDATNSGFEFDYDVKGGPQDQAKAVKRRGTAPVVADEVVYRLWFPTTLDGRFQGYDFALREAVDRPISGTNEVSHDGRELFMAVLNIDRRGDPAAVPAVAATPTPADDSPARPVTSDAATPSAAAVWNPIPTLAWGDPYDAIHQRLRDSTFVFSAISKADLSDAADKSIVLSDAQFEELWDAPADVELTFAGGRLSGVAVTFKQPPAFADAVADYERRFGPAADKRFEPQTGTSVGRWPAAAGRPAIALTESQGIMKSVYAVSP